MGMFFLISLSAFTRIDVDVSVLSDGQRNFSKVFDDLRRKRGMKNREIPFGILAA